MPKQIEKTYPKDWGKISARIRERAKHSCEECGLPHGAPINYETQNVISETTYARRVMAAERKYFAGAKERNLEAWCAGDYDDGYWAEGDFYPFETRFPKIDSGVTQVVLQVHHKDRNPSNNRDSNLICLCLRCHKAKHEPGAKRNPS
jgi:5-methylcytosine-specific restriction endonuclease McrA